MRFSKSAPTSKWQGVVQDGLALRADVVIKGDAVLLENRRFESIKEYNSNPQFIDVDMVKKELEHSTSATIRGVMVGGGGDIIIKLQNRAKACNKKLVVVWRDPDAPRSPHTLDSLAGMTDTERPIDASFKESVEEVAIIKNGTMLIPRYVQKPYNMYNSAIKGSVIENAEYFGVNSTAPINATLARMSNPLFLDGNKQWPVTVGFYAVKGIQPSIVNLVVQPIVIELDSLDRFSPRDTISKETKGKVAEREGVLLNIEGEGYGAIAYREGKLYRCYETVGDFMSDKGYPDAPPYSPILETTLKSIGANDPSLDEKYYPTINELVAPRNMLRK
jgi:hypothetical protein